MPKKDTAAAVLGMLSAAGSQSRPSGEEPVQPPVAAESAEPAAVETAAPIPELSAPAVRLSRRAVIEAAEPAPRTMRLLPGPAAALREAWLTAKRDDVLLTAQDFASALVEEALAARASRARRRTS